MLYMPPQYSVPPGHRQPTDAIACISKALRANRECLPRRPPRAPSQDPGETGISMLRMVFSRGASTQGEVNAELGATARSAVDDD